MYFLDYGGNGAQNRVLLKRDFLEKLPKKTRITLILMKGADLRGNTTDDGAGMRLFQIEECRFLKHEIDTGNIGILHKHLL